ncbi:DUF1697 domain-containing protein [Candidatus Peregrinibacteria bacterium]|nr:MAG: DUF1697 domain-containing protein [Candidatus Peregrinibacteria bacterium]
MTQYAAFLRGINLGGRTVKMAELKAVLEKLDYKNVNTFLASGNAVFEKEPLSSPHALEMEMEEALEKKFGFKIPVLVRTVEELRALKNLQVFKDILLTPATRFYVTFLSQDATGSLKLPYKDPACDFCILKLEKGALFSVMVVGEDRGTVDAMAVIEKKFGKRVTTRNWNTIERMLKCLPNYRR